MIIGNNYEIEFNKRIPVTIPNDNMVDFDILYNLVYDLSGGRISIKDTFDSRWKLEEKNDNEGFQGSFIKRLAKHIFKHFNVQVDEKFLGKIANDCKKYINESGIDNFSIEFSESFDWRPGDFGDAGSCWFSYNCGAPQLIKDNGGCFVKVFIEDKGVARACILPYDNYHMILNVASSNYRLLSTNSIGRLIARVTNVQHKLYPRGYTNIGKPSLQRRVLYGASAILIGNTDNFPDKDILHLNLDETKYNTTCCDKCRKYYVTMLKHECAK